MRSLCHERNGVPLCGVPDIGSEDTGSSVAGLWDPVIDAFFSFHSCGPAACRPVL